MSIGAAGRSKSRSLSTPRAATTSASASAKRTQAQPVRTPGHSAASSFTPAKAAQSRKMPALQVPQRVSSQFPVPSNEVNAAILNAATRTGMDYAFLMAMAAQESTLNPTAQAKTSSAAGLYQFLDQTWLEQMKQHGGKHGFGEQANQISKQGSKYVVKDAAARKEILNLRNDPEASALIGAEYSKANKDYLTKRLGREVTPSEVYMAHFLGRGGAEKFLAARDAGKGGDSAAKEFPDAAKANRGIFYDGARARSVQEVYDLMKQKIAPKVDAYQPPKGNYTYTPRFGQGANSQPGFDWGGGRSSFGFGPHGMAGSGRSNGLGIGTIGASGLMSFGLQGGIGMGSTHGRAGGWQFGRGFDFSNVKVGAPSLGSIGISGLNAFGLNGPKLPSGLGSFGVGSIGGSGLTSFGFGPHGTSTSSGIGGGLSSLGIGSIGGSGLGSFGFSSFGSTPLGGGGSSFGGSPGGGSFNGSGK